MAGAIGMHSTASGGFDECSSGPTFDVRQFGFRLRNVISPRSSATERFLGENTAFRLRWELTRALFRSATGRIVVRRIRRNLSCDGSA